MNRKIFLAVLFLTLLLQLPQPAGASEADQRFLQELRTLLTSKNQQIKTAPLEALFPETSFPKKFYGFAMMLYQPGEKRIVAVRQGKSAETISTVIHRMTLHPRLKDFQLSNPKKYRIQMDFITTPLDTPLKLDQLSLTSIDSQRFEVGVDGLRLSDGKKSAYFFPGDAYVFSILGPGQLKRHLEKSLPTVPLQEMQIKRFQSQSFISYENEWIPLYRGHPVVGTLEKKDVERAIDLSMDHVKRFQKKDGSFLYYYDAKRDSYWDHEHPARNPEKNPYYNLLRHSSGIILFFDHYTYYKDPKLLDRARVAIRFMMQHAVAYSLPDGRKASYIFENTKAKLGGSAIALYVLAQYQKITGDAQYRADAEALKNHILSQIRENGEFYYYYIYPGREKDDPRSFSFYYPGEAIVGLASYYKDLARDEEKLELKEKLRKALHYLFVVRPVEKKAYYLSLPSDAWLMMGVNELWDIPEFREDLYKQFVFDDADKMIAQMYRKENALYPDYVGSFFYTYGDHPYPDGSRCEGLFAAYMLAKKTGAKENEARYFAALKDAVWANYHLINTPESSYAFARPDRAIGGVRLKLTRQWIRIDMIYHVIAFYLRFLPYL